MFSCHDADKYGYLGDFWLSQCATNKLDYFSMRRVISHRVRLSLMLIHLRLRKNGFKYPALLIDIFILYRKHNLDLTIGPVTSLSVAFISFAKKVAIDFYQIFSQLLRILFSLNL